MNLCDHGHMMPEVKNALHNWQNNILYLVSGRRLMKAGWTSFGSNIHRKIASNPDDIY